MVLICIYNEHACWFPDTDIFLEYILLWHKTENFIFVLAKIKFLISKEVKFTVLFMFQLNGTVIFKVTKVLIIELRSQNYCS